MDKNDTGYYVISNDQKPQAYGYNAIKLNVPVAETTVIVDFEGLDSEWGSIQGWRWGFVAVKEGDMPVYVSMQDKKLSVESFTVEEGTTELWLVVSGAPVEHSNHIWDDDGSNDISFPYEIKLTNTYVE